MIVLDSSVVFKWFRPEADSEKALPYLENHKAKKEPVVAPFLLQYELLNILVTKSEATIEAVVEVILATKKIEISFFVPNEQLSRYAAVIALEKSITFYDASYIALAHILKCDLITADKKLVEKVDLPFVRLL